MSVEATLATWRLPKDLVSSSEKLFLLSCANRAGESHECWPSIKRLCADTGLERKTIIKVRQSVIDKNLLEYMGYFKGRSGQIPVMRLTYVDHSVSELSLNLSTTSPKNGTGQTFTSTKNGTGTSTKNGTGDQSQKRDTESKRDNLKEESKTLAPKGVVSGNFSLSQMLENNPWNIPESTLKDWLEVRKGKKAKMTSTAWEQANQNLTKLKEAGLSPIDCFKKAVGNGWAGVEFRYFKQDIDSLNPSSALRFTSKDERAANELKIRERELKAQEEKRREIDDAHNFKKIHSIVVSRPDLTELQKKHEEERRRLGLTAMQYHKVILNQISASSV